MEKEKIKTIEVFFTDGSSKEIECNCFIAVDREFLRLLGDDEKTIGGMINLEGIAGFIIKE